MDYGTVGKNYYITAVAGANNGSSFVVMSKGTPYLQQSYKVSDSFPFKWINKKWREGFYVTSMATAGSKWGIVMSRGSAFSDQVVELDFLYPSEGIHRRWENGYRITSIVGTCDQSAFVLSVPRRKPSDETQETLELLLFLVIMSRKSGARLFTFLLRSNCFMKLFYFFVHECKLI